MHNHQLLSNLINPALPARPVCIHVYVCASVCGTKRNGGVKWISDKSEGRDGQDGGGESMREAVDGGKQEINMGFWVITVVLKKKKKKICHDNSNQGNMVTHSHLV